MTTTMRGVRTQPLYPSDPMQVVTHRVDWHADHSTGCITEFDHPTREGQNFININVHTDAEVVTTFSTNASIAIQFKCPDGGGSDTCVWVPLDKADDVALALLAGAAKARAENPDEVDA